MGNYTTKDLNAIYQSYCGSATATCRLTRELVGGVPASEDGIRAFAKHHLKIAEGEELEAAVKRIMGEEIGERDTTPATGEVKERESYGLNVIRRDEFGPWVGDWQLKAAIKQAASRVELFQQRRGSKGDVAEMGSVSAVGTSLHGEPHKIHLCTADGAAAPTTYQRFLGRVNTPQGAKSIVSDAECVEAGAEFSFCFRWYNKALTEKDIASIFAALQVVGVGSAKALERGKLEVVSLEIEIPKRDKAA